MTESSLGTVTASLRASGASDTEVDTILGNDWCMRKIARATTAPSNVSSNKAASAGTQAVVDPGGVGPTDVAWATSIWYEQTTGWYYAIAEWKWKNHDYASDVDYEGGFGCSEDETVGGPDAVAIRFSGVGDAKYNIAWQGTYYWGDPDLNGYSGNYEVQAIEGRTGDAFNEYGVGHRIADRGIRLYSTLSHDCGDELTDLNMFGGQIVTKFEKMGEGCADTKVFGFNAHTWADTSVNSAGFGIGRDGVSVSLGWTTAEAVQRFEYGGAVGSVCRVTSGPFPGDGGGIPSAPILSAPSSLTDTLTLSASTSDSTVNSIKFYIDGSLVGSSTSRPFQIQVSTVGLQTGLHTVTARAVNQAGESPMSAPATIRVPSRHELIAFQANTGVLYLANRISGTPINTGLGMMPGTSPAIAPLSDGTYAVAFQANTGTLWLGNPSTGGYSDTLLGMMPGTSPAIAAQPSGGFRVAFHANTGNLFITGGADTIDAQLGMKPGTSPSIAPLANGTYQIAFQDAGGNLWTRNTAEPSPSGTNLNLGMKPGTSPSIAANSSGGWHIAFQDAGGDLWTRSNGTETNHHLGMMPSTSPSITALPNGSYQVAFQSNEGTLWTGDASTGGWFNTGNGMMPGTSPAIAGVPSGAADFRVAFQANTGDLFVATTLNLGHGIREATSPAL